MEPLLHQIKGRREGIVIGYRKGKFDGRKEGLIIVRHTWRLFRKRGSVSEMMWTFQGYKHGHRDGAILGYRLGFQAGLIKVILDSLSTE